MEPLYNNEENRIYEQKLTFWKRHPRWMMLIHALDDGGAVGLQ